MEMDRRNTMGRAALTSLALVIAIIADVPAWASSTEYGKALATSAKSRRLAAVVVDVETDLGRAIQPTEWPQILTEPPTGQDPRNRPYVRLSETRDAWGRPFLLDSRRRVYSVGEDGIDQRSGGDDIASWKPFNREHFRAGVWGAGIGMAELVGVMVLLNLFLIPGWVELYWRRHSVQT